MTREDSEQNFDDRDYESWQAAATAALKGKDISGLTTRTLEGIERSPLYTRHQNGTIRTGDDFPGGAAFARGSRASGNLLGWEIRQSHFAMRNDVNAQILADLENGATAITLKGAAPEIANLDSVLEGVHLELAPIHLAPGSTQELAAALLAVCEARSSDPELLRNHLGLDPVGRLARTGYSVLPLEQEIKQCVDTTNEVASRYPNVIPIAIDGSVWANGGASDSQELGAILSAGVLWIRALLESGLSINDVSNKLEITLTVGPDQFLNTAKIRAARVCWAQVISACGGSSSQNPVTIHAQTAQAMLTKTDSWVNMLRATTACFAAAAGGADAITVAPFDDALGLSNDMGLRLARNTQLILQEETKLSAVIDPAGGSWYVEELTDQVANSAWETFQDLERQGGLGVALLSGYWQEALAETRSERNKAVADRSMPLTGTSEFPNLGEQLLDREPLPQDPEVLEGEQRCEALPLFRWSAPFETMREAATASAKEPVIFLANLGEIATHTARSTFALNLFEAGGIRVLNNDGFANTTACVEAFSASNTRIACICSSDSVYSESASQTAQDLRDAGATLVYLAGNPTVLAEADTDIDGFIYLGCDVLEALTPIHQLLN
ncbi:MAG TPA: methylmalonyl-CoA mutase [Acidimicrobiaceae bacterium]|nr:methylmalonyl-CoA mutase [Acidimicrobiaceae bacterium]